MVEVINELNLELLSRVVELEQEAFGEGGLNEWHLVPIIRHGRVFIIKNDESVVGCVQYMLDWNSPQRAYMIGASVAKETRGKGIGTELLVKSITTLFAENICEVELTVAADNFGAVKVYREKLGFKVIDFRKNEYGQGHDRLVMLLTRDGFAEKIKAD